MLYPIHYGDFSIYIWGNMICCDMYFVYITINFTIPSAVYQCQWLCRYKAFDKRSISTIIHKSVFFFSFLEFGFLCSNFYHFLSCRQFLCVSVFQLWGHKSEITLSIALRRLINMPDIVRTRFNSPNSFWYITEKYFKFAGNQFNFFSISSILSTHHFIQSYGFQLSL